MYTSILGGEMMEISLTSKFTGKEVVIPRNRKELLEKLEKFGEIVYTVVACKGYRGYYLHGLAKVIRVSHLRISLTLRGPSLYRILEIEFPESLVILPILRIHEQIFVTAEELYGRTVYDFHDHRLKQIWTSKVNMYDSIDTVNHHLGLADIKFFIDDAEVLVRDYTNILESEILELTTETDVATEKLPEEIDVVLLFRVQQLREPKKVETYHTMFKTVIPKKLSKC